MLVSPRGSSTAISMEALTFCEQFHTAFNFSQEFSNELKKSGIVDERSLEVELTPGKRSVIGTFKRIDEEKFKDLPDATVLDWRKKGFLHACHFQLQSMNNWDILLAKNSALPNPIVF